MIRKWWSGHPFWVPKSMKIDARWPEKLLNCENISFLEGTVFSSFFLMHFSMNFGSPGRPRGASKFNFSANFFDLFARLSLQSCSWGLLGPFRVNISSIFGGIWHDFVTISYLFSICCRSVAPLGPILDCFLCTRTLFKWFFLTALVNRNSD